MTTFLGARLQAQPPAWPGIRPRDPRSSKGSSKESR
jgi:hypothetical protein